MKKLVFLLLLSICTLFTKAQTTQDYIDTYAEMAQKLSETHHLPASLILGVAIHESGAGTSKIARYLNNHFGFKGKNSSTEIKSAYRDFPSIDSSYNHFVTFLKSRSKLKPLFEKYDRYDFKNWAKGLQRGGYAHSRIWASQVIALINKYELHQYDNRPDDYVEPVEIVKKTAYTNKKTKSYTVKQGDNLGAIAKKFGTSVKALKNKNGLKSDALKPGKKLNI